VASTTDGPGLDDRAARQAVEGIDAERVEGWFAEHLPGAELPLAFSLIAGGRSNLTYLVTDGAGARYALRRPPLSHVLPTAHDMAREFRVISALGPTGFPVPKALGLCEDPAVNGAPFYVMEFVDGHILRDAPSAAGALDEAGRARAGRSLAETLAALHAVDVDAVGLGDFAKREGYIERQLRRWYEQFRNSKVEGGGVDTAGIVETVHDRLAGDVPEQRGVAIVHGDFRLDNTVLADDGSVRAVLDWEICTLGDPLADVGLLMVYWTEPGDIAALVGVTPTTLPGFPSRAEMRHWYAARSGRDLSHLDFYVAFGYWKLACILQGVYARYVGGAAAGDRSSVDGFAQSVVTLAEAALSTLEQ
jgi:aminoglycoside phosphotransferase (APT) family kinase protein